jgi:excisionase family DNA binding protein
VLSEEREFQEALIVKLLTAKEVAERLSVSAPTVMRLADAKALPAVIIASRQRKRILRFREESVDKFIAQRERQTSK